MTTTLERGEVTAADGATLGFRRLGNGPALVLLHGSMSSGHNHLELATALADRFTVYLPDRRGRGLSGAYRPDDGLATEVSDLATLLRHADARQVFGVSSGAIIALEAARAGHDIERAAIFEPPLFSSTTEPAALLADLDRHLAAGDLAAALACGMKGAQMGPGLLRKLPDRVLAKLTGAAMRGEKPSEYVSMRALAPTLRHEFRVVVEASGPTDRYAVIGADVLLLGGSKSPAYLKDALTRLRASIPGARRVELPGLDHAASWNADRRGNPRPVADELLRFFT
jgi:pimeloyl-ACP methyl ester carboxylesterase